jgi:hypothetical protein
MKNLKKNMRQKRCNLHKSYLNLISKTFSFIDKQYCENGKIYLTPKQDLKIYGSLVFECSLTDLKKKNNFLNKLFFVKVRQHPIYENKFIVQELLKLLFLPCFDRMTYYLSLQHYVLENGAVLQIDLKKFFFFIREEFKAYLKNIKKAYKLKNLLNIKYLNYNMRLINRDTREFVRNRIVLKDYSYQKLQEIRHKVLTILLLLLQAISKAKTIKEIRNLCNDITSFLFKSDELYCGYI